MNETRASLAMPMARQRSSAIEPDPVGDGEGLAECGWLVEVNLTAERDPHSRYFAVGTPHVSEAEQAILRYPGLVEADARKACRRLSTDEIARLGLRAQAVRPYLLVRR